MKPPRPRNRLRVIAFTLSAVGIALVAYVGGLVQVSRHMQPYVSEAAQELRPLEETYGPARNSEHGEEWIVRDFFKDSRDGVFVDVGANHYRQYSNTYYLETKLGWSGLAIEPQSKFGEAYAKHRPRTRFVALFVSSTSNEEARLYVPPNDLVASKSRAFAEEHGGAADMLLAVTTTLDDILTRSEISRIDFLTMDIELAEPEALAGFSVQRFRPALVCIEAHPPVRRQILEYFARNAYVVAGEYLRADSHNLWFVPLGT